MRAYQDRSRQGENMMRVVYFDHPEWVPCLVGMLPAAWNKYGEALDDLLLAHPRLFPNHQKPEKREQAVSMGYLYDSGKKTDCWGCVWENIHPGIVGQVTGHPLADWAAFDTWQPPDPLKDALLEPRDWDAIARWITEKKKRGDFAPDGVLAHGFHYMLLCDLRGYANVMVDMAMDEPRLHKLLDVIMHYNRTATEKLLSLGTEFMGLGEDLGLQHGLPISPTLWRKFVKPGYEATAGLARDRDIPVYLHSDGHILPIIDDLIETGVRVLNPQIRANGLQGLVDHAKGKVVISLDLDRQLFPFATPSECAQHVRTAFDALHMPEGGLIINCEIGEDVPLENMDALFSTIEDVCRLPDPETTGRVSIGF